MLHVRGIECIFEKRIFFFFFLKSFASSRFRAKQPTQIDSLISQIWTIAIPWNAPVIALSTSASSQSENKREEITATRVFHLQSVVFEREL